MAANLRQYVRLVGDRRRQLPRPRSADRLGPVWGSGAYTKKLTPQWAVTLTESFDHWGAEEQRMGTQLNAPSPRNAREEEIFTRGILNWRPSDSHSLAFGSEYSLEWFADPYGPNLYWNSGVEFRATDNWNLRLDGYNLVAPVDKTLSKRNCYFRLSEFNVQPAALSLSARYRF